MMAHFIGREHKERRLMMREKRVPGMVDNIGIGIAPGAFHLKVRLDEYIKSLNMPVTVDEILRRAVIP